MRSLKSYLMLLAIPLSVIFTACEEVPDCAQEASYTFLKIKFFDKDSLKVERVKYDSIKAIGSDTLFFTSADSLSNYALDINSSSETTTYLFYSASKTDSLSVVYNKTVKIPFESCGPVTDISNIMIGHSTFDSAALITDYLNINISENIEIYQ